MKLHILFEFKDQPWGGANQFLKALRRELQVQNSYADNPDTADIILANANPGSLPYLLTKLPEVKSQDPGKIILARLDGPTSLIRGRGDKIDHLLSKFVDLFADGLIWQSHWSRLQNQQLFSIESPFEAIIHNAADPNIFFQTAVPPTNRNVVKLIATSWSANPRKGFSTYQYLDRHLDFSRYAMTFVGNSPINFQNIALVKPLSSRQLAGILQQHDIYITASQNDPCSNALIEALACGLPTVALNSGGHSEIIGQGGELFTKTGHQLLEKINLVAQNLTNYQTKLPQLKLVKVASQYLALGNQVIAAAKNGRYHRKSVTALTRVQTLQLKASYQLSK